MEVYRVEVEDSGLIFWYQNDKLHRLDGPAVEYADGSKEYWIEGKLHRTDGPAIEWKDGAKEYWIEGKLHRTDGPAIEWKDGAKEYWIEGEELTESEFKQRTKPCSGKKILVDGVEYTLS